DVVPPTPTSPSPSSPVIPSSPPHQSPSPPQQQATEGSSHVFQQVLDTCSALVLRVKGLEIANAAQQLEIVKLKARVKKLEKLNKGRISVDMETNEGVELVVDQENNAEIEGRQADKQAEIYNIDLDHSSKVVAASTPISAAKPAKPKVFKIVAAPAVSTRKRKRVVIRDPEEELHIDTPSESLTVKDKGLIKYPKPMKKKDQTREEMEKEDEEIIKSINETPAQKAAKRKKLATPLAQKVPVVDYQVVVIDNKPNIGEKMEAADFMWCTCDYSLNSSALLIG
nr:hypothetical protein [Tanacetum cinerariifolium]